MAQGMKVSIEQLQRYLTALHFESVPRQENAVQDVCAHVRARRSIQFDPIDVVGRNADLVLQSRIPGYRPRLLQEALYSEHLLYDGYDKNLCIYAIEDFPYFSRMRRSIAGWFRENPDICRAMPSVLEEIDRRGPLCSEEIDMNEKVRWPWGQTRMARAVLESLWMEGTLTIARREGVRKYYDRFERCYDPKWREIAEPNPAEADYFAWQALRRTSSVGLQTGRASDALLCVDHMKAAERNAAFERLTKEGKLLPVSDGHFSGYIPAENEALLTASERAAVEARVRFIAPLDNLMWDRRLVNRLWDFHYRWEIYTPVEQRQYGYYVLPVMLGSRFVARMEPDRFDCHALRIRNWWWEDGWTAARLPAHALEEAMHRFADFLDANDVEYGKALG